MLSQAAVWAWCRPYRAYGTAPHALHCWNRQSSTGNQASGTAQPSERLVLYRGNFIIAARFFVRGKVFQLIGGGCIGLAASALRARVEPMTAFELVGISTLVLSVLASSISLWYYSRRYVGELSMVGPKRDVVRLSVLDFWGNREDNEVALSRLRPPFKGLTRPAVRQLCRQWLMPLNVEGDRQYFMSLSQCQVFHKEEIPQLIEASSTTVSKDENEGSSDRTGVRK